MAPAGDKLIYYPAFCFKASPTHFNWVKMSAADVHRLDRVSGFECTKSCHVIFLMLRHVLLICITASNVFFYNNHPIRFVTIVGLIVARNEAYRRTILTLDDSSGALIEVAILKSDQPRQPDPHLTISAHHVSPLHDPASSTSTTTEPPAEPIHLSSTAKAPLDIATLVPGALVMVKGTLSTFRSVMQLHLERFFPVRETRAELRFLADRMRYLADVLSVPWYLTDEDVQQLRVEFDEDVRNADETKRRKDRRAKRRVEREEKDRRRIIRAYESEERRREKEAGRCREAGKKVMADIEKKRRS